MNTFLHVAELCVFISNEPKSRRSRSGARGQQSFVQEEARALAMQITTK